MNRSNITTRKTIISLFLAFILIAGTITTYSVYGQPTQSPFVTKSELETALADVVTQEDLETALADVVTQEDLETALADVVTQEDLETALENVTTDEELQAALANLVTQEQLQAVLNKTLTVIKNTRCEIDSQICEQNNNIFQPSNFTILVEEDNNPSQIRFPGSSTGTNVELEPGPYNVTEEGLDPITPQICSTNGYDAGSTVGNNLFICTNFSEECDGDITLGNPQTCIIDNVLVEQNFLDLAVANFASNVFNPNVVSILLGTGTGSFGTATTFATGGTSPSSLAIGDFNNDGLQDLAVTNYASHTVSILLGTGTGSFDHSANYVVGRQPRSIALGDFNNDGKLDLATANAEAGHPNSNNVSILLGTGTGTFGPATNFPVGGNSPFSVAVGDFNSDGKLDLATTNNFISNNISILLGTGTGIFGTPINFPVGIGPTYIALGDFNNDGKLDLATTNAGSDSVSILLGTGTGTFGPATNYAVGDTPFSVAVGNFNDDTVLDLAVANLGTNNVSILLGTGTGTFGPATNYAVGSQPRSIALGDFNNDGKLDLATANTSHDNISILLGTGTGTFGPATNYATGGSAPFSIAVGDFN